MTRGDHEQGIWANGRMVMASVIPLASARGFWGRGSWWGDAGRPLKGYSSALRFTGACSWLTGIGVNAPGHVPRGVAHLSRMP